jgi:hypothetical protein
MCFQRRHLEHDIRELLKIKQGLIKIENLEGSKFEENFRGP